MKNITPALLALFCLLPIALTACNPFLQLSPRSSDNSVQAAGPSEEEQKQAEKKRLEAEARRAEECHQNRTDDYDLRIAKTVRLVRKTARVIRSNCDGQVLSDKKETVADPRNFVYLPEINSLAEGQRIHVLNRQTCRGGGFFVGFKPGSPSYLWVDNAEALLTHEVRDGLNIIDFAKCAEKSSQGCSQLEWYATLRLQVDYEEIFDNKIYQYQRDTKTNKDCDSRDK